MATEQVERRCPACNGSKHFCERCWRPMGAGECKRCKRGDTCRTCEGRGYLVEPDENPVQVSHP